MVSAYAFIAGLSGLLTAGLADRFDRKKLLLFFYSGFIVGTLWCRLARSFEALLLACVVTGMFGGVIGAVLLAIATDLFAGDPTSVRLTIAPGRFRQRARCGSSCPQYRRS